jgi:hypothetical protein
MTGSTWDGAGIWIAAEGQLQSRPPAALAVLNAHPVKGMKARVPPETLLPPNSNAFTSNTMSSDSSPAARR